jgi:hypothetical protein
MREKAGTFREAGVGAMWWFPNPMGSWDYVIMAINMVLFWGLIILGLIGLFRYLAGRDRSTTSREQDARRRTPGRMSSREATLVALSLHRRATASATRRPT